MINLLASGAYYSSYNLEALLTYATYIGIINTVVATIICPIIASRKGRSVGGWIFGGLFLGVIGIIIVSCLSNLSYKKSPSNYSWTCPKCIKVNSWGSNFCTRCGTAKPKATKPSTATQKKEEKSTWTCSSCGFSNKSEDIYCKECGKYK